MQHSLPKKSSIFFWLIQCSAWHLKWAILSLTLFLQMSIGRKWKEIIDVNDKITYNFHVKPVLINFDCLLQFINIYDSYISSCYRMILEPKEQQRVDTPYKQCWRSIFLHLCRKAVVLIPSSCVMCTRPCYFFGEGVSFTFVHSPHFGCWYYYTLIFEMVYQIFLQNSFVIFFCHILNMWSPV